MNLQPTHLKNDLVTLVPLQPGDFDRLFIAASDPLIWEQHPDRYRYQEDRFRVYFDTAIESKAAFLVLDTGTGEVIGCTRYYDVDIPGSSVAIGYTFLIRSKWATPTNRAMKDLMTSYAFEFVDKIIFHVGENNMRSQKAVQKLGAVKTGELIMDGLNRVLRLNFIFELRKPD